MIMRVISWGDSVTSGENSHFEVETGWREIIWSESDNLTYLARKLAAGYKRAAMGNFTTFITHYFIRGGRLYHHWNMVLNIKVRDVNIAKKKKISPKHSVLSFWQKYLSLCFHPSSNSSFTFLTLRSDVAKIFVSLRFCILPEFGFLTFRSDFSHAESPHHPAHSILLPFWEFAKYIQSGSNNIKYKVTPAVYNIKWNQQHLLRCGPPILSTKRLKDHLKYKLALIHQHHKSTN